MTTANGKMWVIAGPSGSGKTTLCNRLAKLEGYQRSISATTRKPRVGEKDGLDYYFLTSDEFTEAILGNHFLEYAKVVGGEFYGTFLTRTLEVLQAGTNLLLAIDVQGHQTLRACHDPLFEASLNSIFLMPKDRNLDILEQRLRKRNTGMSDDDIRGRLEVALVEMSRASEFDHVITTTTPDQDFKEAVKIISRCSHQPTLCVVH